MRTCIGGIVALATVAVAPAFAQTEQVKPEIRSQIEGLMRDYTTKYAEKNAAGAAILFAPDAVVLSPTSPTMVIKEGRESIQTYLQYMLDKDYRIEGKTLRISPLGDDAVIVIGEYHTTGTTNQGHAFDATGYWSAVDVREGNLWKIRLLTAFPKPRE